MKPYRVTITETSQMEVTVKADSLAEAEGMVENDWENEEYVLDDRHFIGADFKAEQLKRERGHER